MTEKEQAICEVIEKRICILDRVIAARKDAEWYEGIKAGLQDALTLLGKSIESIRTEL